MLNEEIDGFGLRIFQSYLFPHGMVYTGEISSEGKVLYRTQAQQNHDSCRRLLLEHVDNEIGIQRKRLDSLDKLHDILENGHE